MSYLEAYAICPYYMRDSNNIIKCEMNDIKCRDKEMFRFIGYGFCAKKFEQCMFKQALDNYYATIGKK